MLDENQGARGATRSSSSGADNRSVISSRLEQFEKRQNELWRLTFIVLLLLGVAYVLTSWDAIRSFWHRFEAIAFSAGLFVLIVLFAVYMWNKNRELSEMRGLMRGLEQRDEAPPSERQLDQLAAGLSRLDRLFRRRLARPLA
jgi:uncharacterized membrane protein YcjF (UPF0283 family)